MAGEQVDGAGGCTTPQYQAWLKGRLPKEPVKKRKHLRLVANQKQAQRVRLVRQRRVGPNGDGPAAA